MEAVPGLEVASCLESAGLLSCAFSAKQLQDDGDDSEDEKYVDRESCCVIDNKTAYPRAYKEKRQ